MFQSLLLQVSFKTANRSPARRSQVSIPSPSGLLQNAVLQYHAGPASFQSLLLQVSFKTRIGRITSPLASFNPFSFRSPSKHEGEDYSNATSVSIPSPSGLLQNSGGAVMSVSTPFQSLLLQVSFKTAGASNRARWKFQSLLLQVSFKTGRPLIVNEISVSIPSPSGLLQNAGEHALRVAIPVSIPSPSGLLQNPKWPHVARRMPFQSLLLQVSFKTRRKAHGGVLRSFNPFSFRSPSKRRWPYEWDGRRRFNPFSFRSPSKRNYE